MSRLMALAVVVMATDLPDWTLTPIGVDYAGGTGCDNEGQKRLRTYANP